MKMNVADGVIVRSERGARVENPRTRSAAPAAITRRISCRRALPNVRADLASAITS